MSAAMEMTEATFDELVASSPVPVLVEFGAEWCPPCRALAPVLSDLAEQYDGRLAVVAIDTDAHPELARRFEVQSVPTLLAFSGGTLRQRLVGARSGPRLIEELSELISPSS